MPADERWDLTLILLTWRIWWVPNNASRWQMGFNSAFKGLTFHTMWLSKCVRVYGYIRVNVVPVPTGWDSQQCNFIFWMSCLLGQEVAVRAPSEVQGLSQRNIHNGLRTTVETCRREWWRYTTTWTHFTARLIKLCTVTALYVMLAEAECCSCPIEEPG